MGLNNKGQTVFSSIIFALMIFMIGMLFISFLKDELTTSRSSNNLDCSNGSSITDGNKLMCLFTGVTLPIFILAVISLAGGVLLSRFLI